MTTKLSDLLPLLTHPDVGERICEAAGVDVEAWCVPFRPAGTYVPMRDSEELPACALAALAHGVLTVLAIEYYLEVIEDGGKWRISLGEYGGDTEWCPTLPDAIFAAARRVWLEEGE